MKNQLRLFWHYNAEKVIAFCLVAVVFTLMIGAIWAMNGNVKELKTLEVGSGELYECEFFYNGDMECEKVGDPDVGGGRMTP